MEKDISITSKNQNLSTYSRRNIRKWGCIDSAIKEHRDAYDHIVRIFASTTKKVPEGYDYYSYIKGNLEKAYGHEYRAFLIRQTGLHTICGII